MGSIRIMSRWNSAKFGKWGSKASKRNKKGLQKAVQRVAFSILRDAKKLTPVRTGALRASGRVMELGPLKQEITFGGAGSGVNYAAAVEYGTGRTAPKPYLRPAVKMNRRMFQKEVIKVVQNAPK